VNEKQRGKDADKYIKRKMERKIERDRKTIEVRNIPKH